MCICNPNTFFHIHCIPLSLTTSTLQSCELLKSKLNFSYENLRTYGVKILGLGWRDGFLHPKYAQYLNNQLTKR